MPEHIGKVMAAGHEAKRSGDGTNFVMKVDSTAYYLFKPAHVKVAQSRLLLGIKVLWEPGGEEGKFRNVESVEAHDLPAGHDTGTGGNSRSYGKSPEERADICQQVAIKAVVDLVNGGNMSAEQLLRPVAGLLHWIEEKLPGPATTVTAKAASKAESKQEQAPTPPAKKGAQVAEPKPVSIELEAHRRRKAFGGEMVRLDKKSEEAIRKWMDDHGYPCKWEELSTKAQEEAIAIAKREDVPNIF